MNCPACSNKLTSITVGNVTVDVCKDGCAGVWLDQFEFKKIDEQHEHDGDIIEQMSATPGMIEKARFVSGPRQCPKCLTVTMMRHFESVKRQVEVDECAKCAGMWLDAGELNVIRHQYKTEAERTAAAAKYFGDVFDKDLDKMRLKDSTQAERAEKIMRAVRFICPSQYIPKKTEKAS